jgi:hypothetical protein
MPQPALFEHHRFMPIHQNAMLHLQGHGEGRM